MTNANEKRLLRVLDHIHDNPAGDLSLDALSDVAAMSRFHWHRVFRAMTGETLAQAVRRIRMQRASYLLAMTDQPLAAIAASVGMESVPSFKRCFAEAFLMSPTAFRKRGELRPFVRNIPPRRDPMHPIAIRTEAPTRLAALPHKGAYFEIARAFEKLSAVMASRDLVGSAGRMIAVFYDDPQSVAEPDLRSHAGFEIRGQADLSAPLEEVTLPGGRQAVLTYKGPYAGLPAAYDELFGLWLPQSGEEPADAPSFEVYLNTPMDTAPEDLITELHLPLKG
ncbi:AraC family transcriptional regulator [Tabrizicola sp.]|uniref:AraC family transcriptional regulator n=1 Tax=Tabrizicola sp. TaxID=2005166 RepID=UPI001A54FCFD|nr:AraC family transcriptional regulator [Tabrizicola sp.]MBL9075499.1 AraC family transcriptional regulator [Tabrizicola sp.]